MLVIFQAVRAAIKHCIELICYPANSTQALQAADKFFNNLKNKMASTASMTRWISPDFTVRKDNFVKLLHQGILQGLPVTTVKAAWRSSGSYPVSKEHLDWKYITRNEDKGRYISISNK